MLMLKTLCLKVRRETSSFNKEYHRHNKTYILCKTIDIYSTKTLFEI